MYKKMIAMIALLTLVLAGCGTTDKAKAPEKDDQNGAVQSENNNQQPKNNEADNDEQNEPTENLANNTIRYKVNGVDKSAEATAKHNDNQNYTMNVLPDYTFTAEEPNNDVVYVTDQSNVFMRIQLLESNVDWNALIENSKDQLESVNKEIKTMTPPAGDFFKDAVIMETTLGDEIVTTYLIKNHSVPLKLMLFTTKDADHTDAFLKMAQTIVKD